MVKKKGLNAGDILDNIYPVQNLMVLCAVYVCQWPEAMFSYIVNHSFENTCMCISKNAYDA